MCLSGLSRNIKWIIHIVKTLEKIYIAEGEKIAIAVTHLDMTGDMVICPTGKLMPEDIAYMALADMLYKVNGETAADVICQPVTAKALSR